jgi:phage baseplate assembly protein V
VPGVLDAFERFIAPIKRRLSLAVVRALLDTTDDSGVLQVVQVIPGDDEVVEDVEVMHPYGFTSHAPKGSPVLMLAPNGNHELAVALVGWKADRPAGLEEGEVALAHENGNTITLKNSGDIEVVSSGKVVVNASGDIELGGAALKTLATEDFVNSVYKAHVHAGVTTGPGSTGAPTPIPMPTELTSKTKAE